MIIDEILVRLPPAAWPAYREVVITSILIQHIEALETRVACLENLAKEAYGARVVATRNIKEHCE
jgi:hypothetical protein